MSAVLGIHVGHHSSCAVVQNGQLIAAVQQERLSGRKHDGEEALTSRLPISACLQAANIGIDAISHIVSSFQSVAEASFGLHKPLIEDGFDLFDPFDHRHSVVSHHLAHAWHALAGSGFRDTAVLVADLAGSSTTDGLDFVLPFAAWYDRITSAAGAVRLKTECLSIYNAEEDNLHLIERQYGVPHIQPYSFVWSPASLYDNIARRIFADDHAHGQLMALAALVDESSATAPSGHPLVRLDGPKPTFTNNWQHLVPQRLSQAEEVALAAACQDAFTRAILHHAERALALTGRNRLAVAGGVFLNIVANSRLAGLVGPGRFFVPSAPHDAGIAVGCAFLGSRFLARTTCVPPCSDRLGPRWADDAIVGEAQAFDLFAAMENYNCETVTIELARGRIVGRWHGRSEFGPRALGARSILATPLDAASKERLNRIKGRQPWRPVAPVVIAERAADFFDGPWPSPWMLYAHRVRDEQIAHLPALTHPDRTTRAQTLDRAEDVELYGLLEQFNVVAGVPILVNTSLNGRGQPIIERPADAIRFFLGAAEMDALIVGSAILRRRSAAEVLATPGVRVRLARGTLVTLCCIDGQRRTVVVWPDGAYDFNREFLNLLTWLEDWRLLCDVARRVEAADAAIDDVWRLLIAGAMDLQRG